MGGTLWGITERLDYLLDLGVNLIYLAPIFFASANHRYNTCEDYRIDLRLGTFADFQAFLSKVHANGIRVLIDGDWMRWLMSGDIGFGKRSGRKSKQ
ncbi:MAG: alpha-amylase family glycosyl hydrolase [Nitrospirota bacterium]